MDRLRSKILDVPNFPKPGIIFRDITPLLSDADSFRSAIQMFISRYRPKKLDAIVAIESRGFFLAAPLAYELGLGLHLVRKRGKLPRKTHQKTYDLEYGSATLEIHQDELMKGQNVVLMDDLLATGGTAEAAAHLVEMAGVNIVELAFLIELTYCQGRQKLKDHDIFSVLQY
ncbi:MAG: adenine phosphoribosyltransferase [Deltaproteobacteria bacterium]|nr:adenine phosphoribosyltransferase [Deltaproteobacteria bacterium]